MLVPLDEEVQMLHASDVLEPLNQQELGARPEQP
jgi:hypothetical protein